ncbi:peptidoglycan D,D-transpeptidase FtsI family protein [Candidatus Omnitrophota bacterium]
MFIRKYPFRFEAVFALILCALLFLFAKLSYIQFFRSDYLDRLAQKQHNLFLKLEPDRGNIYDRNLRPFALNLPSQSLYAVPLEISDTSGMVKKLSELLDLDTDYLEDRLNRRKYFIWIARKLAQEKYEELQSLKLKGLGFIRESSRYYPNRHLASHVLGFTGIDFYGLEGLELYYDTYLKGKEGWCFILRDAKQKGLLLEKEFVPRKNGYNLVLTIDENIQFIVERELDVGMEKYNAKAATIVMMDPKTGEILAMANRPTFDPHSLQASNREFRRNRAITDFFEPGSVFKIVTASAALEEDMVTEDDVFFCENGEYRVANHILHDHRPHANLTFREVIEQSSNIGVTKVAQILGPDIVYQYMKLFGFGDLTGIDLPGEVSGIAKDPSQWSKTSIGAIPMGQEVTVTTLQLARAISCIANKGILMKPFVVRAITDQHGELIKEFKPREVRRVISEDVALRMQSILTGVVERGTGRWAKIKGVNMAGKTGTAQKVENGTYSHSKFRATFIGFIYNEEEPIIAMAIMFDEPRPHHFGGTVSGPVFKAIARDTLKYLNNVSLREAIPLHSE